MRRFIFAFAILGISLCVSQDYFIEIIPHNEPDYYEMKLGDIVTFKVVGYKKGESADSIVSLEEKVFWQYDKNLLQKVSSDKISITLKAIREGNAQLCATTIIKNKHCQKKISILIIR